MGTVIRFPRVRGRHETPARAGASADIIILPVVRIERMLEPPPGVKAKAAKSMTKSVTKPVAKSVTKSVKSAAGRKRRKRAVPALRAPVCGRG
jgi:hypothetical protein